MKISRRSFIEMSAAASAMAGLSTGAGAETGATAEPQRSIEDSEWVKRNLKRKPNILIALLDDVGFADVSCFGSEYSMPCADNLAKTGTRFNNFHVTAVCAPTRACLLSGRNAHAVGVGNIAEWGRENHPGYKGWIREGISILPEMLKSAGYNTTACGKWHLTPLEDQNGTGSFDQWPVGRGFDHWYGFHGSAADHWHPEMFEDSSAAYPVKGDDYHLSADLVDHSIEYIKDHLAADPEKPFFHYLAFGACHFPIHAPVDDIERHSGKYDKGWDKIRVERFERQKELGIIPQDTELPPDNTNHQPWSSLSTDQKRYAARGQEVYAAFMEHTDVQLQRLVDFLKEENQYDDTIIMLLSDNGASYGGGKVGMHDVRRASYLGPEPFEELIDNIDKLGSDDSQAEYAAGWAQASNTPLKWYKSDTYEGGVRSPLIVTWPNGNLPKNVLNGQYHHVTDVVPTLLNMINHPFQEEICGKTPLPIQGTSFAYTFDNPSAPTKKKMQYYETLGDRAIWADGWKAVTRHKKGTAFDDDVWDLYHAAVDFNETRNLSEQEPELLEVLKSLWQSEAARYDVLPLEDDTLKLYQNSVPKPRAKHVFYPGMTRLDRLSAPDIYNFDSRLRAEVTLSNSQANGVILASGDSGGGYELYMQNGYLIYTYVYTRNTIYTLKSHNKIPPGSHVLGLDIKKTGENSAKAKLLLDGESVAVADLANMWPIYNPNSGIRCGENRHAPISRAYKAPFVFDQDLTRVVIDIDLPLA